MHSLSLKPKNLLEEESAMETFITAPPIKIQNNFLKITKPTSTYRPKRQKETISVREHQNKLMKELKSKIPTYYKELKTEFIKIRDHSEMTFEQYNYSKRLRRTNPYKIRTKVKSS